MTKSILLGISMLLLIFVTVACSSIVSEKYDTKTVEGLTDKNVKLKHKLTTRNSGEVNISFSEKQIPYEVKIVSGTKTYQGGIEVSGTLEAGCISLKFMDGEKVIGDATLGSGKLDYTHKFELYDDERIVQFNFIKAKTGKVKIKYYTLNL